MTSRTYPLLLLLIAALASVAFAPAWDNEPSLDDVRQAARYEPPSDAAGWLRVGAEPWWPVEHENYVWRPLARTTIAVQKAIHGEDLRPLYAFNVLLHALTAVLLAVAARRVGLSPAASALAGAIFAVHPSHAEAVHQIVGRTELLSGAAMLGGIALLARGVTPAARWQQPLLFAAALAGKENAVVYPVIVVLLLNDAASSGRSGPMGRGFAWPRGGTTILLALAAVGAAWLVAKGMVTGGWLEGADAVPAHENVLARLGFLDRLPGVLGGLAYFVAHVIVPGGLSPDYSARSLPLDGGFAWPWAGAGAGLLVALVAVAVTDARRGGHAWRFVAAGLVSWAITSNGPFPIGVAMAERLWFWPSAFVIAAAAWTVDAAAARAGDRVRGLVMLATGIVVTATFTWRSLDYARAWQSPYDLAHATLAQFPDGWRAHVNLARLYYERKQYESGRRHGRDAVRIAPDRSLSWQAVGLNAMFLGGGSREAEDAFRRALALDPREGEVHRYLANVLEMRGDLAGAAEELARYLSWPGARDRAVLEPRLQRLRGTAGASP